MNMAQWLVRAARAVPASPAIGVGTSVHQTYAELGERAARLAAGLRDRFGLEPGDRVAIIAKNCPGYVETLYGIWHGGFAAVPANAKLHGAELAYILEHSGARVCFATGTEAAEIAPHRPDTLEYLIEIGSADYEALFAGEPAALTGAAPDDLAWLFYTSGTTGRPKGAMLSHRNLMAMSLGYLTDVDVTMPGQPVLHAAPMSHGSGMYILPHLCRMGINVVPESGGFEPSEIQSLAAHWRDMSMFAAPTMIKRLVDHPADFEPSAWRTIVWGGAPMHVADTKRALERFGPRLAQIYGQGESPMTISVLPKDMVADAAHPDWDTRLESAGFVNSTVEMRIGGPNDEIVPPEEAGEILVRGDAVMLGYWNNEEATAAALRGGWLHTGDVGAIDAEGFLTLKDRSKDMIISGGSNIYPREVEEVLLRDTRVREVSVIGRPDPDWGEIVVAYVVGDAPPSDLDQLCMDHIARFKRPKDYVQVDALPKNNYGKILKTELRALDQDRAEQTGKR